MTETEAAPAPPNARLVQLLVLAGVSTICYAGICSMSWTFGDATPKDERMTLAVLTALGAAFVLYWLAIVVATRTPPSRRLMGIIVGGACLFRVVLLPSVPIHEIDIYRYLWDGAVLAFPFNEVQGFADMYVKFAIVLGVSVAYVFCIFLVSVKADKENK